MKEDIQLRLIKDPGAAMTLMNSIQTGIIVIAADFRIVMINDVAGKVFPGESST